MLKMNFRIKMQPMTKLEIFNLNVYPSVIRQHLLQLIYAIIRAYQDEFEAKNKIQDESCN